MRAFRRPKMDESTYDLNLAPMLDIIVSIIPMLLLSVVFVEITVVETPVPQAVERAVAAQEEKNEVQITLSVSKSSGFRIVVNDKGQTHEKNIALKGKDLDIDALKKEVLQTKLRYPNIFRVELNPDETVPLAEIVAVMDGIRTKSKTDPTITFTDVTTGKPMETDLMFPDVVFGNVAGG